MKTKEFDGSISINSHGENPDPVKGMRSLSESLQKVTGVLTGYQSNIAFGWKKAFDSLINLSREVILFWGGNSWKQ